ncbi:MAG: hypothetical protein ACREEN_09350 [Stellaceae bacterium]
MNRKRSFSRRTLLAGTAITVAVTATQGLSRSARADDKVSKDEAKYQNQPKGQQRCEICVNFQPPNQCLFVQGEISPKGWCQFFAARDNAH